MIYALSSGSIKSGIAVIRISGTETKNVILKITKKKNFKPRSAIFTKFFVPGSDEIIDEGILIWFPNPNSYTGEDLAEFHIHGSKAVIEAFMSALSQFENSRLAEPGEFTKIALQNGKMDLLKVEAISDLISSETELQRKQALDFMSGNISSKYSDLRSRLIKILANIEAKIDFPEEDLPEDILKNIKEETQNVINIIQLILNDNKIGEKIREGFKLVILGPTNAGKSSLLNYFAKREVAIVSEIEGTTRDLIEVHLNFDGYPVVITDTAGIRKTTNPIEQKGHELAISNAKNADLKIILLDAKKPDFKGFFEDLNDENTILVVNKSDLIEDNSNFNGVLNKKHILISVKNEKNLSMLTDEIKKLIKSKFLKNENVLISRERHRLNLKKCVEHLDEFMKNNSSQEFDKAAEDLRLATRYLGKVVGEVDVEEVLGKIFNDFCIGK